MRNILRTFFALSLVYCFTFISVQAQVGINNTNSNPDASAMLDVESTDKGMLIPRMTTAQRNAIASPATGLIAYDTNTQSFWYYDSSVWVELIAGGVVELIDADGDTKIQVEEGSDDDIIRFDTDGTEHFRMENGRLYTSNTGLSVIIGQNAGSNDDFTNNENVYIGYLTGRDNVSASGNIGIGRAAQENHISGNFTVAIGNYCLQKHETGANNISIGGYAMNNLVDGVDNVALGTGALRFDSLGDNNVAIGAFSLYNGLDMDNNVAIGHYSGYNASGNGNVFLGRNSGRNSSTSNSLYIDNSNTNSPLIYGEFDNDLVRVNGTFNSTGQISGDANLDIETTAVVGNISVGAEGTDQTASTIHAGDGFITTPWLYTNVVEAQGERGSASTLITVGNDGTHGVDDQINFVTSGNPQMTVASDGRVGIDKQTPQADLHIRQSQQSITNGLGGIRFEESSDDTDWWRIFHSGIYFSFNRNGSRVAYVTGTGAWTVDSDLSLKKNINNIPSVLERVTSMRPVSYHYLEQENSESKTLGFIAQEVQPLFPEMVVEGEDGKLGMIYSQAGVISLRAIQEQQLIIEEQAKEINDLKQQLSSFEERLKQIEERLD